MSSESNAVVFVMAMPFLMMSEWNRDSNGHGMASCFVSPSSALPVTHRLHRRQFSRASVRVFSSEVL